MGIGTILDAVDTDSQSKLSVKIVPLGQVQS